MNEKECIMCVMELTHSDVLPCSHKIHLSCFMKLQKKLCPFCRTDFGGDLSLNKAFCETTQNNLHNNIQANGILENQEEESDDMQDHVMQADDMQDEEDEDERPRYSWNLSERKRSKYRYLEEDPDYDEENPYGDSYDYP